MARYLCCKLQWIVLSVLMGSAYAAENSKVSQVVEQFVRVRSPVVILSHVRVVDGTGKPPMTDRNVVIEGGKISRIELAVDVKPKPGTEVISLPGYTVIPGLVGMHNHLYYTARPNLEPGNGLIWEKPRILPQMLFSSSRLYLAAGVTTMRTTGSVEPYADLNLRDQIDAGQLPGPHLDVTGPYLEGKGSSFIQMHQISSPEEAVRFVDYWADQGVTSFKAYMHVTRAELKAAIDAVHRRGLKITGHLCSVTYSEAAEMGIDDIEHGFALNTQFDSGKKPDECPDSVGEETLRTLDPDGPDASKLIDLLVSRHVAVTSTLPVFETRVAGSPPLRARALETMTSEAREAYLYARNEGFERPKAGGATLLANSMKWERRFAAAGGLLLTGPDPTGNGAVLPGFGDQRGIELLVEAGFSPVDAIRIGTLNGAIFEQKQESIGSIEEGKNADLVVIRGDPSQRIADIENVEIVFKDGIGYDSEKLIKSVAGRYGQY